MQINNHLDFKFYKEIMLFSLMIGIDIGATLSFTLFLNTMTPHISKIAIPVLNFLLR
jgi:hypothetical protein